MPQISEWLSASVLLQWFKTSDRKAGNDARWNLAVVFISSDLLQCLELRNHVVFIGTEQLKPSYRHLKHASEERPDLVVVRQLSTV